jgi:membrane protein
VLAPLIWWKMVVYVPALAPFAYMITFARFTVAAVVIVVALVIVHLWLPAGRRNLGEVLPGILATLALWLISGEIFGRYLADFAYGYVTMYAGLASVMIALVFLYISASIFIFGGELNSAIGKVGVKRTSPAKHLRKSARPR